MNYSFLSFSKMNTSTHIPEQWLGGTFYPAHNNLGQLFKENKKMESQAGPVITVSPMATVEIPAPVSGVILRHAVNEGEHVSAGTTVAIIESMKMELEIRATSAGNIHFLVSSGTQVASKQLIAEIQAEESQQIAREKEL
jgi:biotin carboxyl carrier protein